jgi:hypothetical protein
MEKLRERLAFLSEGSSTDIFSDRRDDEKR